WREGDRGGWAVNSLARLAAVVLLWPAHAGGEERKIEFDPLSQSDASDPQIKQIRSLRASANELAKRKDFRAALKVSDQAVAACEQTFPVDTFPSGHQEFIYTLAAQADLLHKAGKDTEAIPVRDRVLAMARRYYSSEKYPD